MRWTLKEFFARCPSAMHGEGRCAYITEERGFFPWLWCFALTTPPDFHLQLPQSRLANSIPSVSPLPPESCQIRIPRALSRSTTSIPKQFWSKVQRDRPRSRVDVPNSLGVCFWKVTTAKEWASLPFSKRPRANLEFIASRVSGKGGDNPVVLDLKGCMH